MELTKEDALLAVTWFESILNNNPRTTLQKDYRLAQKLYKASGLNVPLIIKDNTESDKREY